MTCHVTTQNRHSYTWHNPYTLAKVTWCKCVWHALHWNGLWSIAPNEHLNLWKTEKFWRIYCKRSHAVNVLSHVSHLNGLCSLHKIDTPIHETTQALLQRWLAVNVLWHVLHGMDCAHHSQQELYLCLNILLLLSDPSFFTSSDVYSVKEPFSKKLITSLIDNRWR